MLASLALQPRAHQRFYRLCLLLAMLCTIVLPGHAATAFAAAPDAQASGWVANGTVNAVVQSGNTIYIGGSFTYVGPPTGSFSALSQTSGAPNLAMPAVNGAVYATAPDGSGGWYLGGSFTAVGGVARSRLAHVRADKTLDTGWNPSADNTVYALVVNGTTIYAGGAFANIGAQARGGIAAIDATSGNATAWSPNADGSVYALAVSGSTVYAGGDFTTIGGQARNRLAALDSTSGNAAAWNPDANNTVYALAVNGSTVYAGGNFTKIGALTRLRLAALDTSGTPTNWNPVASNSVRVLVVSSGMIYAGGAFTTIAGLSRNRLAAINAATGALAAWDPNTDNSVYTLAVSGSTIYAGGDFTTIGGQARNRLAALDSTSGTPASWNPNAGGSVYALAASGSTIYAGGTFTSVGGQMRNNLAALDGTSGALTTWNPNANNSVYTLAISGSTVYAGGDFGSIGGQARNYLGALDAGGAATAWNPNADNSVRALAISGSTVYAGGDFGSIGGQARNYLGALDAGGAATMWDPNADNSVRALAVRGDTVYAGGDFGSIGGQARNYLGALDTSGAATAWNPNANGAVRALAARGDTVYAGGDFGSIGGQARNYLGALDASGAATMWDPNADNSVRALAVRGDTVYAGGDFGSIGGQARNYLGALDAGGAATAWNPNADNSVRAFVVSETRLVAGGTFETTGGVFHPSLALFAFPQPTQAPTASATAATNISASGATLHGSVNAQDSSTTIAFQVTITSGSYGSALVLTGDAGVIDGVSDTPVQADFSTALPNSSYFYRVVATNGAGTTTSAEQQFTTAARLPTATTTSASLIGATATLTGSVNAWNSDTTVSFQLTTISGDYSQAVSVAANPGTASGLNDVSVTGSATNLAPNTIYYYRVLATNEAGSATGTEQQFSTIPGAPTATTIAASQVTTSTATLNGTANATNSPTTVRFQYTLSAGDYSSATDVSAVPSSITGSQDVAVSVSLSQLVPNTTYYYRLVASNQAATITGSERSFTTLVAVPSATTSAASEVSASSATLHGLVNAQNSVATIRFQYTTTAGNYTGALDIPGEPASVTGTSDTAVTASAANLAPNTTYFYHVIATNEAGATAGAEQRFTTSAVVPTATTITASAVTTTTTILSGTVNAQNSATAASFQYTTMAGDYTQAINVTANPVVVSGRRTTAVSARLIGLTPNSVYYYRLVTTNSAGTTAGVERSVTTAAVPPTLAAWTSLLTLDFGKSLTLRVNASGSGPFSYQWYQGQSGDTSAPIRGATANAFTTPMLTHTTSYWVQVSNAGGSSNSGTVLVTVYHQVYIPIVAR